MTIHYHGTPITPNSVLETLVGFSFCVSHARPDNQDFCRKYGKHIMLDNAAWSFFTRGQQPDWLGFYAWCGEWFGHPSVWAVIPDVIDGEEADNDALIAAWPHGTMGAPVWHMHESFDRLLRLAQVWPRVCIGSSRAFRVIGTARWHWRMNEAMNLLCGDGPPPCLLHMLRGMAMAGSIYPFATVDSTDIGRNHNRKQNSANKMARAWSARHCPAVWARRPIQQELEVA